MEAQGHPALAQVRDARVAQDALEPGEERLARVVARPPAVGLEQGLLGEVACVLLVPHQGMSEALRAPTHETHEVAEGLAVPGVGADHELGGFHQEGVHGP